MPNPVSILSGQEVNTRMGHNITCLCGGTTYRCIRGPFPGSDGGTFSVMQCDQCGLARTDPPPFSDDLTADVHQSLRYEDVIAREARWRQYFGPIFRAAQRHAPRGRFLDVGCGPGLCVKMAGELGYDAVGVEINERSSRFAREQLGRAVMTGDLASARFPSDYFDVVLLSQVLEHLANPAVVLDEIRRVLRPDGVLIVEVPNIAGLQVSLLGARWEGYAPYMHVWQFTPASVAATLTRCGYSVVQLSARQNMELGTPLHPLKRLVRQTVFRALELLATATNRADKLLCVARPRR